MLRVIPKFKGFRAWASMLLPQSQICNDNISGILQPAPPTIDTSDFVKEMQPLPLPVMRQQQLATKWTTGDYLTGDPQRVEVMVPKEINLHRWRVMDRLDHNRDRRRGNTHAVIVTGAQAITGYPFRQKSEFLYLCDCLLPGVVLLVMRNRQLEVRTILFQPLEKEEIDPALAELACQRFNVDEVLSLLSLKKTLQQRLQYVTAKLWYTQDNSPVSDVIREVAEQLKLPIDCPRHLMQHVRSFKTKRELLAIRRANSIAAQSLQELMAEHEAQHDERQLGLIFANKCRQRYAHQPMPYEPRLVPGIGSIWLMDASCQYAGYYGGLARYWSICGRFKPPQKMLYNMLVEMRSKLCFLIRTSNSVVRTPRELHAAYLILLAEHLQELRVLPTNLIRRSDLLKAVARFNCFSTLVRHVGLDFGDSSDQLLNYHLMPGNVISLQLSIYIPNDCLQAYPEFRGVLSILNDCIHINDGRELELLTGECVSKSRDVEELRYSKKRPISKSLVN
ncbi:xaa-Pro aminopeptidase 3 [Drosophila montana]|uniref:xaa-Pro aminopeptidase 3 n=1 Tax=Drosophila montana TaxID=40370 RepID=UPI00313E8B38